MQRSSFFWFLSLMLISGSVTLASTERAVIDFRVNSSTVDYFVAKQLDEVFDKLPFGKQVELVVVSDHDVQYHYQRSVRLSRERCTSIAAYFIRKGVDSHHLTIHTYRYRRFNERIDYSTFLEFGSPLIFRLNVFRTHQKAIAFTHSEIDPFQEEFCQYDYINSTYKNELLHAKNAVLRIPARAFESISGEEFDPSVVQIKFCVYLDQADFLLADITSNATKRWLESGGMVFIEATSAGVKLKLKPHVSIQIDLPLLDDHEPHMSAFTGADQYNLVNWTPSAKDQVRDQPFLSKRTKEEDMEEVWDLEGEYESDYEFYEEAEGYFMEASQLGWINCDRFLEIEEPTDLIVNIHGGNKKLAARLVFYDENSVLPGYKVNSNGLVKWEGIPKGERVALVVYGKEGDDFLWATKELTIGETEYEEIEPSTLTKSALKAQIKKFAR